MKKIYPTAVMPLACLAFACGLASFSHSQSINEIRIDQPGTDNQEYFELAGTPGQTLGSLTYLVIGDGTGGSGVIESVTSLAGFSFALDGFFLAVETSFSTLPPAGFPSATPDATFPTTGANTLNFENTDNVTHLLVSNFTGLLNDDLDTNDDGVLDVTPWSAILSSVGILIDPTFTTSERVYSSTIVGPDGLFAPGHVFRFPNGTGPFQVGDFDGVPAFQDTPGTANPVPEPATMAALLLGAAGIAARRRRK